MKNSITIELVLLLLMILVKAVILHRNGIKALSFGKPDKNAFVLMFIIACFAYATLAPALGFPLPSLVGKTFWNLDIINGLAVLICTVSLIWFGITLIGFGHSFRIGIDKKTKDKLITTGTFTISRNPVFIAFIAFFLGVFLMYANMITLIFLLLLMIMIHRQIIEEEKFLKKHYEKEYEDYCKKVRRYI